MVKKIILALGLLAASCSAQTLVHTMAKALACADSSGSGTTQVCNTSPTYTPVAGDWIIYSTTTTNTGDVTVNVNSLGAKHVRKWLAASVLASGDLPSGVPVPFYFDGTYWEIATIGNAPSGGGGSPYWLDTGGGTVNISATAFTQPSPACGRINIHGTTTVNMPTTNPPAGTCIIVDSDYTSIISFTTTGGGQGFSNNYVGGQPIMWNSVAIITADGTGVFHINSVQGPANDIGDNDLFYGYGLNGQFNGYNTMFCTDCGNSSMGFGNAIFGRSSGKNAFSNANLIIGTAFNTCDAPNGYSNYLCLGHTLYADVSKGIVVWAGSGVSLSSCGTGASLDSGSNDIRGRINVGTSSSGGCTLGFANTHHTIPSCVLTDQAGFVPPYTVSTSGFVVSGAAGLDSTIINYHCDGFTTSSTPTP